MLNVKINIEFDDGLVDGTISINDIIEKIDGHGCLGCSEVKCGFLNNEIYNLHDYQSEFIDNLITTFQDMIHSYYEEKDRKSLRYNF